MSTLHSGVTGAQSAEVLSPELVLVDPALAVRARQGLADPDDTFARPRHLLRAGCTAGVSTHANGGSSSTFDDATAKAVRRLAQASLAPPASDSAAQRPRRLRRLVAVIAAVSVACALALFVAELQLDPGAAPATVETSALPVTADVGTAPALGSSLGTTEQARAPAKRASGPSSFPDTPPTVAQRRLAWAPADGASGYHVELFRGASRVFAADTTRPQITIPAKWTLERRQYRLEAVAYRWYVWPIVSGRRTAKAVVQARLVVRDR